MRFEISSGVNGFIQPTSKFKTILIEYKFRTLYDPKKATERTLLGNMLVTSTKKYPSQKEMDRQMSWLYGASLSSNSQRYGNQQVVTFRLRVVNDKFIGGDDTLLEKAFSFLNEIIFHPNVSEDSFHEATFNREKINLQNYFSSIEDNKAGYSVYKLNEVLFKGTDQQYLGMGDEAFLTDITPETLYQAYLEMVQSDTVDIFVSGDVENERITDVLGKMDYSDRAPLSSDIFVNHKHKNEVQNVTEEHDVTQGRLLFGFSSESYYMDENYFAAMVFNGLLGAFPHSKLFQNVREKESLAYSASSYIDFIRGTMIIQTGIEVKKKDRVNEIVLKQLADMQAGDFTDELILQTKNMLINHFKQTDDNQTKGLSKIYLNHLLANQEIADDFWISSMNNVTREDIIKVANQMKLQAVFFLKGVEGRNA